MNYHSQLSLDALVSQGQPIFVKNTTYKNGKSITILLEIQSPYGGSSQTVLIPAIKHPINLTARAHGKALAVSPDLRRYINGGELELMDPEKAIEELSHPGVSEVVKQSLAKYEKRFFTSDRNKLKFRVNTGPSMADGPNDGGYSPLDFSEEDLINEDGTPKPLPTFRMANKSSQTPKIVRLIEDLKRDYKGRKEETLLDLQAMPDETISDDDLGFIIKELGSKKTVKRIVQWAQKMLSARQDEE